MTAPPAAPPAGPPAGPLVEGALGERLEAAGWSSPIRILCARPGLACECGSLTYRTRPEPVPARPLLVRVRCEGCGRGGLVDPADPGADVAEVAGAPVVVEQPALF